jgi:hypothetical protein
MATTMAQLERMFRPAVSCMLLIAAAAVLLRMHACAVGLVCLLLASFPKAVPLAAVASAFAAARRARHAGLTCDLTARGGGENSDFTFD